MKTKLFISTLSLLLAGGAFAQFHTMKIPRPSPKVTETQQLGITDITLEYSSPATRGRDVWNEVINSYGDPNLAWRAGANMNTRISFSTDVTINGNAIKAGSYGIHVDQEEEGYKIMFAHHDNQWGSYYLDRAKHVTLTVVVQLETCPFSEQLDFEFSSRTDSTVVIGLEWGEQRLPFTVGVDLNKTVVENFRYELLGINTYRWQAWNDAARWCLNRGTNLDEALAWATRSIEGGYGGFSANKNITNMTTKARLLHRLDRETELVNALEELAAMDMTAGETNQFTIFMLQIGKAATAEEVLNEAVKKYPDAWFLQLNRGIAHYLLGDSKKALKQLKAIVAETPENFQPRLGEIIDEVTAGTYKIPGT